MDEADTADQANEMFLKASISSALAPQGPPRVPGACANCGEPIDNGQAYCDDACREDAEHRYKVLARTTVPAVAV